MEKVSETKSCFFGKITSIDKCLSRFTNKRKKKDQVNKIRNESKHYK